MTQIIDLAPDQKIQSPGFYRMPLSQHHGQPCDGLSVTSGILRQMELATPADVWAFHQLNPERWERKETDALRLGVAMALFVEGASQGDVKAGAERVLDGFRIHAEDKPRRPTKNQIALYDQGTPTEAAIASVEYWRAVDAEPDDWLTPQELDTICTMGAVLARDPMALQVLAGEPEVTMAWQDEVTGIWCLSRPDTLSLDGAVADYKKINTQGRPFTGFVVDRRIEQHGYHMQMAFAWEGYWRLMGEHPGAVGIVAQWDAPPHHVILRGLTEEALEIGRFQNHRALRRFKECWDSGHWPGPGEHVGSFMPSDGWWKRVQEEMQQETAK